MIYYRILNKLIEKDLPVKNKFYDVKMKYLDMNVNDIVRLDIVNF